MALLEAQQVTKRFGSLVAVNRVDVGIEPGSIHAIIGPNGAGKTTLFNCVTGVYQQEEGTITSRGTSSMAPEPTSAPGWGSAGPFRTSACSRR